MATVSGSGAQIGGGLVLLFVAGAMRQGSFTVGDLALFTAYASALTSLPRWLGQMLARRRQSDVALPRLARMQPGRRVEEALAPARVDLRPGRQHAPTAA